MQSFVLVSEEAISKGIRRIVALTGPEALKAEKKCHALEVKVEKIQNLVEQKMKESGLNIKETSQEIARLTEVRINSGGVNLLHTFVERNVIEPSLLKKSFQVWY